MNINDKKLDDLFRQARQQEPVVGLDETKRAFITATVAAAGGVLATKSLLKLLTVKKWIFMISSIVVITTGSLIISLSTGVEEPSDVNEAGIESSIFVDVDESPIVLEEKLPLTPGLNKKIPEETILVEEPVLLSTVEDSGNAVVAVQKRNKLRTTTFVSKNQPKDSVKVSTAKIKAYSHRFRITENTTDADLDKMKENAKASGIKMSYKSSYAQNKLTKVKIALQSKSEDGNDSQQVKAYVDIEPETDYTIAWHQTENGKIEHIYCGTSESFDHETTYQSLDQAREELDRAMTEVDFDQLAVEMDSLAVLLSDEFALVWDEITAETELYRAELAEVMADIDREKLDALFAEISENSEEWAQELKLELLEVQRELEHEMRRMESDRRREIREMEREKREIERSEREELRKIREENRQQLKATLVEDGLIGSVDDQISIAASYQSIRINGTELQGEYYEKYKGLLKELFNVDVAQKNQTLNWVCN